MAQDRCLADVSFNAGPQPRGRPSDCLVGNGVGFADAVRHQQSADKFSVVGKGVRRRVSPELRCDAKLFESLFCFAHVAQRHAGVMSPDRREMVPAAGERFDRNPLADAHNFRQ